MNYQKVKRHLQVSLHVLRVIMMQKISYSIIVVLFIFHFSFWSFLFLSSTSWPQDESLTFQSILDDLEADILKHREELDKMQILNNEAQISKKAAKVTCWVFLLEVAGDRSSGFLMIFLQKLQFLLLFYLFLFPQGHIFCFLIITVCWRLLVS